MTFWLFEKFSNIIGQICFLKNNTTKIEPSKCKFLFLFCRILKLEKLFALSWLRELLMPLKHGKRFVALGPLITFLKVRAGYEGHHGSTLLGKSR